MRRTLAAVSQTLDQEAAFYARPVGNDDPARTAYGVRFKPGTLSPARYQELLDHMEDGRLGWSGTTRVGRGDLQVVFDPDTPPDVSLAEGERLQQIAESVLGRPLPGDYYPTESALITRDQYATHLADVRGNQSGAARALRAAQEFYPNIVRAVADDLAGPRTLEAVRAAVKEEKTGRIAEGLSHASARGSFSAHASRR